MASAFSFQTTSLDHFDQVRPRGFCVLVDRLLGIQSSVSVLFRRHLNAPRLGTVFRTAHAESRAACRALEALSRPGTQTRASDTVDRWLTRLLVVGNDPVRLVAHALSPTLHDLRIGNRARQVACRFVSEALLGPELTTTGVRAEDLFELPVAFDEHVKMVEEIEALLELQTNLCTEVYEQFLV